MAPIIPIIAAVAPPLIRLADSMISGEKQGPKRKSFVRGSVAEAINQAAQEGVPLENLQQYAPLIDSFVEVLFQYMDTRGEVNRGRQNPNPQGRRLEISGGFLEVAPHVG